MKITALNLPVQSAGELTSAVLFYAPSMEPVDGAIVNLAGDNVSLAGKSYSWRGEPKGLSFTDTGALTVLPSIDLSVGKTTVIVMGVSQIAATDDSAIGVNLDGTEPFFWMIKEGGTIAYNDPDSVLLPESPVGLVGSTEDACLSSVGDKWCDSDNEVNFPSGRSIGIALGWERAVGSEVMLFSNKGWAASNWLPTTTAGTPGDLDPSGDLEINVATSSYGGLFVAQYASIPTAVVTAGVEWMAKQWTGSNGTTPTRTIYPPFLRYT